MNIGKITGLILRKIFGSRNERMLKVMYPIVEKINALEGDLETLSDAALKEKTGEFQKRLEEGQTLDDLLPEAFAVVREASKRTLKMRHYDVQMIGGIVLHRGMISEMVTGEGKTLVATLAAYLNALGGASVHIVTVNDYLAHRDRDWMGPIFEFLGLTVGALQSEMDEPAQRQVQYACNITYGTNSEFGFDYLRDNMKTVLENQVQKTRDFAIIDEVDSILIDEARTPLIISGPSEDATDKYNKANRAAKMLRAGTHYEVKEKDHTVIINEAGIEKAEEILGIGSFYEGQNLDWPHHIDQALKAHNLFKRDRDYVINDGEIVIVDEFTGRLQPGRRWSDGLHQAIEAKEGLSIREENQTLATITIQNFFKLYKKLAGMTGTAMTEASEFDKIYGLDVMVIPTNKPLARENRPDVIFRTEREKFNAIEEEIVQINETGRPVLVGTISIEKSELLSKRLQRRGIDHEVLNAKHHEREAQIITQAGQSKAVTIATNMAGRGTDIILGEGVAEIGGLHVLGTERHEARRIDNQLRGRCGRQGDPGSSRFYLSLEDDLMRIFASERVSKILERVGMSEGQEIESRIVSKQIEWAQRRVEETNFDRRKSVMDYDDVMNEQRTLIYGQRQALLEGRDSRKTLMEWFEELAEYAVEQHFPQKSLKEEWDTEGFEHWLKRKTATVMDRKMLADLRQDEITDQVIEHIHTNYTKREKEVSEERMRRIECWLMTYVLDNKWKDHLLSMDYLRAGIGLRGYAGVDPKIAYKKEGYELFADVIDSLKEEVTDHILHVRIEDELERSHRNIWNVQDAVHQQLGGFEGIRQRQAAEAATRVQEKPKPIRAQQKVGRNDPCPCGSGKKYKKCCGMAE